MHTVPVDHRPPPTIGPVPESAKPRPFWSVMIPTFNCANYLRETLRSVLAQAPSPEEMEIEVVDDCSTRDDPEAVVREIGGGRVRFYRQPRNQGPIGTFNTCIHRARGEWVHILHGDDTVRVGYYEHVRRAIALYPDLGAVTFRFVYVEEDGLWSHLCDAEARVPSLVGEEFKARMLRVNLIMFPAMIVRRASYEQLGGFRPELVHCADWDMWLRIVLNRPVLYDPEPLACYRVHSGADTARLVKTGENVVDERRFLRFVASYVPPEQRAVVYRAGMRAAAIRAISRAQDLWRKGRHDIAYVQLREAMRCSMAPAVMKHLVRFAAWAMARDSTMPASAATQLRPMSKPPAALGQS